MSNAAKCLLKYDHILFFKEHLMKQIYTYTFVTAPSFLKYGRSGEAQRETKMRLKILITERPEIAELNSSKEV